MLYFLLLCFFFFFKQKTAYEMRISDWSSDVCSSDLKHHGTAGALNVEVGGSRRPRAGQARAASRGTSGRHCNGRSGGTADDRRILQEIGRASCRERVCQYV